MVFDFKFLKTQLCFFVLRLVTTKFDSNFLLKIGILFLLYFIELGIYTVC